MRLYQRPGYFFTLTFASAVLAASCVPLAVADLLVEPAGSIGAGVGISILLAIALMLQWRYVRPAAYVYLGLAVSACLLFGFTGVARIRPAWMILGALHTGLLIIFVMSRQIRRYLGTP
jgi:hypothetical protein